MNRAGVEITPQQIDLYRRVYELTVAHRKQTIHLQEQRRLRKAA
jgi:hypothetical protein